MVKPNKCQLLSETWHHSSILTTLCWAWSLHYMWMGREMRTYENSPVKTWFHACGETLIVRSDVYTSYYRSGRHTVFPAALRTFTPRRRIRCLSWNLLLAAEKCGITRFLLHLYLIQHFSGSVFNFTIYKTRKSSHCKLTFMIIMSMTTWTTTISSLQVTINSLYFEVLSVNTTMPTRPWNAEYLGIIVLWNFTNCAMEFGKIHCRKMGALEISNKVWYTKDPS